MSEYKKLAEQIQYEIENEFKTHIKILLVITTINFSMLLLQTLIMLSNY